MGKRALVWPALGLLFAGCFYMLLKESTSVPIPSSPESIFMASVAPILDQKTIQPGTMPGLTLFLCGDVMLGRGVDQILPHSVAPRLYEAYVKDAGVYVQLAERKNGKIRKPVAYTYPWGDALQVWQQKKPDLKLINLETSITQADTPWPGKGINYRMHPENVAVLEAAGIGFCSLANNHTLDWGRSGLLETMQCLRGAKLPFAGAGANEKEAGEPAILKTRKGRVIVLAYGAASSGIPEAWTATPGQAGINLLPNLGAETVKKIKAQVKAVKQAGDLVVFSVHWGNNWGYAVTLPQQTLAHQLLDSAGVDMVYGHSAHHPLGLEVYKGKLILYGAGDFINDYEGISGHAQYRPDLSLMYFPELEAATGRLLSLKMIPMQIRSFRLHYAAASDAKWLASTLDRESKPFGSCIKLQQDDTLLLQW